MRLAAWGIEWLNSLFDDEGAPLDDAEWSARHDVTRHDQLATVGAVMTALDADALIVLGDFNDGPGLAEYEGLFGRSSAEVVLGEGKPFASL